MATATRAPAQRRLRALLVSSALVSGAVWGAVGVSLAVDAQARAALDGRGPQGLALVLLVLAALPLGSLTGAPVLDAVSHAFGR